MSIPPAIYPKAQRHLSRRDAVLKRIIKQIGPCTLRCNEDYFAVLARAIIAQQISTKAANSIYTRLRQALQPTGLQPRPLLDAGDDMLKQAGISPAKMRYLRDLAARVDKRELVLSELPKLTDEEVIAQLLPVKGIGRWTAEMFLIFGLGRLDVLPVADLGLRVGVQKQYELPEQPAKEKLIALAEPWQPYRSIATWFIWRTFGNSVPQSTPAE